MKIKLLLLFISLFFGCTTVTQQSVREKTDWRETIFNWPVKIDYNQPVFYLAPGELSYISMENKNRIDKYIFRNKTELPDWEIVKQIYKYMMDTGNFSHYAAGGTLIAKRTVDQIINDKTLSGCHDWGLVLSTLLRDYNIPAIFCDTALTGWAAEYLKNTDESSEGHIFVEAYIDEKWVLLNSTNPSVIYDYDPLNPLLGFERKGTPYYVMFKGIDPWDYGIYGLEDMLKSMASNAGKILRDSQSYTPNGIPEKLSLY